MHARVRVIALSWIWAAPLAAGELLKPLDSTDFQANSFVTGDQSFPAAAADGADTFLLVWQSFGSPGDDASSSSIQGQAFDAQGGFDGSQFQVNDFTTGSQNVPRAAGLPEGFLVAWHSFGSPGDDADGASIQARYVGLPPGEMLFGDPAQFQVNEATTGNQLRPDVDADAAGNAVIVWDDAGLSIEAIQIDSSGSAGSQFQVNTLSGGVQTNASVAVAPSGHFVVAWQSGVSGGDDDDGTSIQAQRYNANGTTLGSQFQVNDLTAGNQSLPQVVFLRDEAFSVSWQDEAPPAAALAGPGTIPPEESHRNRGYEFNNLEAIQALINYTGIERASERFNEQLFLPTTVALLFLVERLSVESPELADSTAGGDASASYLEAFLAGDLTDEIVQINTTTPGRQTQPTLALAPSGRVLAAWTSRPPPESAVEGASAPLGEPVPDADASIRARLLTFPVYRDGFEEGDTARWSSTVPVP